MSPDPTHGLLEVVPVGDVTVARFVRRTILDADGIEAVGDRLRGLARGGGHRLLLNFSRVESLTSAMLGKLVTLHAEVEAAGGRLAFCSVDPFLSQIFALCKIPDRIPVYPDEAAGCAALAAVPGPV